MVNSLTDCQYCDLNSLIHLAIVLSDPSVIQGEELTMVLSKFLFIYLFIFVVVSQRS